MNFFRKKHISIVIILITVSLIFSNVVAQENERDEEFSVLFIDSIKEFITDNFMGDITDSELYEGALHNILKNNPELLEEAIKGMFDQLDEHSTYFTEEEYKDFSASVDGEFGGIGIQVSQRDGYVVVIAPIENTPGDRAGLKSGDRIIYVDDTDITGWDIDNAVSLMRGEAGTFVRLGIERPGQKEIIYFDIIRDIIKINPISYEILEDEKVGYLRISHFSANADAYVSEALEHFDNNSIDKLIIDIRNNPGGRLDQAIDIAEHFIPEGKAIVHTQARNLPKQTYYSRNKNNKDYDIVVLINEGSASASEILAGAIKDNKMGTVIGMRSFGKGTVQQIYPLSVDGAVKMTIASYFTPDDIVIEKKGVIPDVRVKNDIQPLDEDNLVQFQFKTKPTLGDAGDAVMAAKERLNLLGYDIDVSNDTLDEETFEAIKDFQAYNNLYPYGTLDYITKVTLSQAIDGMEIVIDKQIEKALELLNHNYGNESIE